ncbi:MAG: tryptophan synthase subunit alpha [Magnetococcus sp. WYHC-3]
MNGTAIPPLQNWLQQRLQQVAQRHPSKPVLLMSHLVLGHPSLEENLRVIDTMVAAGVDIMELQIPFSEPIADGPVIARANQSALEGGFHVDAAFELLRRVSAAHAIPFLVMTYYNILLARGETRFIDEVAQAGGRGLIIPDLPLEQAADLIAHCRRRSLAWVQLMTPTTPAARLEQIGAQADGLVYCVARKGVTGAQTSFDEDLSSFLGRCRRAAGDVPLAVGFGVASPADVTRLVGLCDIAVVGSAAIRIHESAGVAAVGDFFRQLR